MTALDSCQSADFLFLMQLTGLTKGNLSSHLTKLEHAALVEIEKRFLGKVPQTTVRITPAGKRAIERHWQRLETLRKAAADQAAHLRRSSEDEER
jgi:DNA-binding MarR family transcriptional regulator